MSIWLQYESPGAAKAANWLSAPDALFAPALRIYWLEQAILDGMWEPSAIKKA